MKRREAIKIVLDALTDELVVVSNGFPSRDAFNANDRPHNFYMLGSMGLASPIGLGLALARPNRKVVVFDGDGNLLMSLGMLAQIASARPANFVHIVFDNEAYGSTGGQPTISSDVNLAKLAEAAGYAVSEFVDTREQPEVRGRRSEVRASETELQMKLRRVLATNGPTFLLVKVSPEEAEGGKRVSLTPEEITERFSAVARS